MLIGVRDDGNKLHMKDVLAMNFDMHVEERKPGTYVVALNKLYDLDESFDSYEDAENEMIRLAGLRNQLESELRDY